MDGAVGGAAGGPVTSAARASAMEEAFALAFGDLEVEAVLALREGTAFRHFPAPAPDRYRGLLSVAVLDAYLHGGAARNPPVTMADSGREGSAGVPAELFSDEDGRLDLGKFYALFDAGATLVVSQFQEHHPPLARFCRGLELLFRHPVQCNAYLTPPGAKGFRVHFDTHDVIVLQVQGEKHWRLWHDQPLPQPTRRTPWEGGRVEPPGEPTVAPMRPGDALYVPRGVLHDAAAQAGTEPSLHLTIGFLEPCWAEVLRTALFGLEREDATWREAFPIWRLGDPDGMETIGAALSARLAALAGPGPAGALVERMAMAALDTLGTGRAVLPARGLFTPPPDAETRLRLSDTVLHHVAALPDGTAELRWPGDRLALDATGLEWLARLEEGATPAELGEGGLAFCRRLAAAGLLARES